MKLTFTRSMLKLVSLLALLLSPAHGRAADDFLTILSGNKLYDICGQTEDPSRTYTTQDVINLEYCNAYITGVIDEAAEALSGVHPSLFCLKSVTLPQIHDVVVMSLRNHPEERHFGAQRLVVFALAEAFPCK